MKKPLMVLPQIVLPCISVLLIGQASAQFLDNFNGASIAFDRDAISGWTFFTGDGAAIMDFQQREGYASILVDATKDQRNIWWALIRRCVSEDFDLSQLSKPNSEFRIEARIRASHAPRRVNLHLNTQRTTDFHSHLMEFDIPDTLKWHTIYLKDFGMVRVVEILGGDHDWNEKDFTFNKLCQRQPLNRVLNSQMIIDVEVTPGRGSKNLVTISNPVRQRMIDGKTLGLALRPLGAVSASFYARENQVENFSPKLHFNIASD
jgi:hypothetical protein